MRPITITMQAFGSYGKKTTVDFTKTSQDLFLITGDTGAGKTTIFDAIVFALYGEASSNSNKKEGVVLQSQYVGTDITPYVEYTFKIAENEYTIKRVPRHMRDLKRASSKGNTQKEETGSLSLIMPDGMEYPSKEANKKIEEIVGLTKEQFMQVAMIAQGEFMELLRAKSDNKKKIFRKLFNTGIYDEISNELAERKKQYEKDSAIIKTKCQTELERVNVMSAYEGIKEYEVYHNQIKSGNIGNIDMYLAELEKLCTYSEMKKKEAEDMHNENMKKRDAAGEKLVEANTLMVSFEQLETAKESIRVCEEEKEHMQEVEKEIKKLTAINNVNVIYQRMTDSEKMLTEAKNELTEKKKQAYDVVEEVNVQTMKYVEAKLLYESKSKEMHQIQERADKAIAIFDKKKEAGKRCDELLKKCNDANDRMLSEKNKFDDIIAKENDYKKVLEKTADAKAEYAKFEADLRELSDVISQNNILNDNIAAEKELFGEYESAVKKYSDAKEAYTEKKAAYDSTYEAFLDNQAGVLAKTLKENKPCPVCGSTIHPAPHNVTENECIVSREELIAMEDEAEKLRKKQEKLAAGANEIKTKYDICAKSNSETAEKIAKRISLLTKDESDKEPDIILRELLTEYKAEEKRIKADILSHENASDRLKEIENEKEQLALQVEKLKNEHTESVLAYENAKAVYDGMQENADYASVEEANAAKEEIQKTYDTTRVEFEKSEKKLLDLKEKLQQLNTLIEKYENDIPQHNENYNLRKDEYEKALKENDISEDELKNVSAESIKEMQDALNKYNERKTIALTSLKNAEAVTSGKQKPDIISLKNEKEEIETVCADSAETLDNMKMIASNNNEAYKEISKLVKERMDVVVKHGRIDRLYRIVSGNMSGARMDLETYVLRYHLNRVLYAANKRFWEMSAGQYELRLCDIDKAGVGKNRGLDLMVYSAVTGKVREIGTLSGGESYMAALSLALGLADCIQAGAAAISLDMMFIDEGFGMLDEHSRNQAVRILKDMSFGNRLVGIISHVSELKQEIDSHLIVTRDEYGSKIKWNV